MHAQQPARRQLGSWSPRAAPTSPPPIQRSPPQRVRTSRTPRRSAHSPSVGWSAVPPAVQRRRSGGETSPIASGLAVGRRRRTRGRGLHRGEGGYPAARCSPRVDPAGARLLRRENPSGRCGREPTCVPNHAWAARGPAPDHETAAPAFRVECRQRRRWRRRPASRCRNRRRPASRRACWRRGRAASQLRPVLGQLLRRGRVGCRAAGRRAPRTPRCPPVTPSTPNPRVTKVPRACNPAAIHARRARLLRARARPQGRDDTQCAINDQPSIGVFSFFAHHTFPRPCQSPAPSPPTSG